MNSLLGLRYTSLYPVIFLIVFFSCYLIGQLSIFYLYLQYQQDSLNKKVYHQICSMGCAPWDIFTNQNSTLYFFCALISPANGTNPCACEILFL
ncbi:hypothetical protein CW304_17525 [Bacillus sp. UFRGS-B20]|nr:hypothetical protein CW304_17525 [Bacillus sp. UFRGS-B20]